MSQQLETVRWGTGTPAVFVHGSIADGAMTFGAQQPLAEDHELILVNRRGYGGSPADGQEDFERDAAEVAELLPERCHLVGHSYGAVVSLLAAAKRPERILSLTVFEPPALGLTRGQPETEQFIAGWEAAVAGSETPEQFLGAFFVLMAGDPSMLPQPLPDFMARGRDS